jgi:hypothetical protein
MAKQRDAGSGNAKFSSDGGAGLGGMIGGMLGGRTSDNDSDGLGGLLNMGGKRNPLDEIIGRLGS